MLKQEYQAAYEKLHRIYKRYKSRYKSNPDSKQICCMWSTYDPPDIIEGTKPFLDIEKVFEIKIDG